MKYKLLLITFLIFSAPAAAGWPTAKELYRTCFHMNVPGLKSYNGRLVKELREYCQCRSRHIKNYHRFTTVAPPKVVIDFLMFKINQECLPRKKA